MPISVKFIGALRHLSGKTQVSVNYQKSMKLENLISQLSQEMPALAKTFSDQPLGDSKSNSLILVNGREISVLNGVETELCDGDEVVFVPVVHGG